MVIYKTFWIPLKKLYWSRTIHVYFKEALEEIEELRANNKDLTSQVDNYRTKYLTAQQTLEEERRQVERLQTDNCKTNEQVKFRLFINVYILARRSDLLILCCFRYF